MGGQRANAVQARTAIEVTGSHLHMAVLEPRRGSGAPRLRTRSVAWRKEAPSLLTEAGRAELASALAALALEERLRGAKVCFALNRSHCTTRVITGARDRVRRELEALEARTALYLGLGHGAKALASDCQSLDARHEHALLAVANRRTIDSLLAAAADAGLEVESVEPSVVVLSRVLGHLQRDADSPQLFVAIHSEGLELGISYAGRLILDHRPGGPPGSAVAQIVGTHLNRLTRYCQRSWRQFMGLGRDAAPLRIHLFGPPATVEAARADFETLGRIEAKTVETAAMAPSWEFEPEAPSSEFCPAIGLCLPGVAGPPRTGPNFLDRLIAERRQPLLPALLRACWPIAAVALVAAALGGLNMWERSRCSALELQIADLETTREQASRLRQEILTSEAKTGHLERIQKAIVMHRWDEVLSALAHCLPENVWLERLEAGRRGNVSLKGASYGEEGTYELSRWLSGVPGFAAVQLEGMQPQRLPTGLVTKFDMKFDLAGQATPAKEAGKNE